MWKDFFDFTYTERIAVRVLLVLILASLGLKYYLNHQPAIPPEDYSRANQLLLAFQDSLELANLKKEATKFESKFGNREYENENYAATDSLCENETQSAIASEWRKYPFKGAGEQTSFSSLKNAYSLNSLPASPGDSEKSPLIPLALNQCADSDLIQLPCIGPVLAKRIIAFRDRLGGFYSPAQILEVYGLQADCFPSIAPRVHATDQEVRKLSLNFASREELASHPYLGKLFADKIIRYRKEKGFITSLDKLQQDSILPDSVYLKIQYYLSLE